MADSSERSKSDGNGRIPPWAITLGLWISRALMALVCIICTLIYHEMQITRDQVEATKLTVALQSERLTRLETTVSDINDLKMELRTSAAETRGEIAKLGAFINALTIDVRSHIAAQEASERAEQKDKPQRDR